MSFEFEFTDLLAIAKGAKEDIGLAEKYIRMIRSRFDCEITLSRLANISAGPDPKGKNTRLQVDSLNHTVQYIILKDVGQARFSMENKPSSKKGTSNPGVLMVKFYPFYNPSTLATIHEESEWNSQGIIVSLGHYVLMLGDIGAHNFDMNTDLEGCRSWTTGISTVCIQTGLFHLNVADRQMGWEKFSTTPGLTKNKLADEIAYKSLERLTEYFKYYFTLKGERREVAITEGRFHENLPSGKKMLAQCDYLRYLKNFDEEEDEDEVKK